MEIEIPKMPNQNPEQIARDSIDSVLSRSEWAIQNKSKINLHETLGVAVREYQTDIGPADYVLFVDGKPAGVVEAKVKTYIKKWGLYGSN